MWTFNDQKFDKKFKDQVKPYSELKQIKKKKRDSTLPPMKLDFDRSRAISTIKKELEGPIYNSIQGNKTIMHETLYLQTFGEDLNNLDNFSMDTSQLMKLKKVRDSSVVKQSFPSIDPMDKRQVRGRMFFEDKGRHQFGKTIGNWATNEKLYPKKIQQYCGTPEALNNSYDGERIKPNQLEDLNFDHMNIKAYEQSYLTPTAKNYNTIVPNSSEYVNRAQKQNQDQIYQNDLRQSKISNKVTDHQTAQTSYTNYASKRMQQIGGKKVLFPIKQHLKSGESPADHCYNIIESNIREFQQSRANFNPVQSQESATPLFKQSKLLPVNHKFIFKSPRNATFDRYSSSLQSSRQMPKIFFDKKNEGKYSLPPGQKGGLQQRLKELNLKKQASINQTISKTANISRQDNPMTSLQHTGDAANSIENHQSIEFASNCDAHVIDFDITPQSVEASQMNEQNVTFSSLLKPNDKENLPMSILDQNNEKPRHYANINQDSSIFPQQFEQVNVSSIFRSLESSKDEEQELTRNLDSQRQRKVIGLNHETFLSINSPKDSIITSMMTPVSKMNPKLKTRMTFYEAEDKSEKQEDSAGFNFKPVKEQQLNSASSNDSVSDTEDDKFESRDHQEINMSLKPRNQLTQQTNDLSVSQTGIHLRPEDNNDSVKKERIDKLDFTLSMVKFKATGQLLDKVASGSMSKFARASHLKLLGSSKRGSLADIKDQSSKIVHIFPKIIGEEEEPEVQEVMKGLSEEMKIFVQMAIQELDEHRVISYKQKKMKRRMFQDPDLFQDSSDEENSPDKPKFKLNTKGVMNKISKKLSDEENKQKDFSLLKIGREQVKMKQIEMQIQALSCQIESSLNNYREEISKEKKKIVEDPETDDEIPINTEEETAPAPQIPPQQDNIIKPLSVEITPPDEANNLQSPEKLPDQPIAQDCQSPTKVLDQKVLEQRRSLQLSPTRYVDPVKLKSEQTKNETELRTLAIAQQFMSSLLKDAKTKNDKFEKIQTIQKDLKTLLIEKKVIEKMIQIQIANQKISKNKDQNKNQLINKLKIQTTDIGAKLQDIKQKQFLNRVVGKVDFKASLFKAHLVAKDKIEARKYGRRIRIPKNYWQSLVRKHILGNKKGQFDIKYISRLVNLQNKLELILGEQTEMCDINIGKKYKQLSANLWKNHYIYEYKSILAAEGIEYKINPDLFLLEGQIDLKGLFHTQCQKQMFFEQAKKGKVKNIENTQMVAQQEFFEHFEKKQEKPMPAFAQMTDNCMFLSQFRTSDVMAEALKDFLITQKGNPTYIVKKIFIDDCQMKDHHFSTILEGIVAQGEHLQTLVYSSNELGPHSMTQIKHLVPFLRELQINNIKRQQYDKFCMESLLTCIVENGIQMQKLKLSNFLLSDMMTGQDQIVQIICEMIKTKQLITHYDFSWSGLLPKQLVMIMQTLCEHNQFVKNLNLGYNTIYVDDLSENSELFNEKLIQYISNSTILNHIDISGMGFSKEQILPICMAISGNLSLIGAHLNDLGLTSDKELALEILDMFNISENSFTQENINCYVNRKIQNPEKCKKIVKNHTNVLTPKEIKNMSNIEARKYEKHILQVKQGKSIGKDKIMQQTQVESGIGRIETSLVDQFVLNRNLNEPELIFNQDKFRDIYFDIEFGESWRLSLKNDCHVCKRHKCTYIFYQQPDPPGTLPFVKPVNNNDLVEVTDKLLIQQVKDELCLNFHEIYNKKEKEHEMRGEIAPLILGTITKGKWTRKLRMCRADIFATLSICRSSQIVHDMKQYKIIKSGIEALVLNSQNLVQQDCIDYFRGWESILWDKCTQNTVTDLQTVNMPNWDPVTQTKNLLQNTIVLKHSKKKNLKPKNPDCQTFVYAAYLPPGLHQFMIYDPVSDKVFVKDVIIELSTQDPYPEFPSPIGLQVQEQKATRANVWRKWKTPTEKDLDDASFEDMSVDFDPTLFLKNQDDQQRCKDVLQDNFENIRIAFLEGQSHCRMTFPEISMNLFIKGIRDVQTPEMVKQLPKGFIENCFIRATRGDEGQGTLCRGEYMETLARMVAVSYPMQNIAHESEYLQDFLDQYIAPVAKASTHQKERNIIQGSNQLNQFLFDNLAGLKRLFLESKQNSGFTYESALRLLTCWTEIPTSGFSTQNSNLNSNVIFEQFVKCQMVNCHDLSKQEKYETLSLVEYLEFISRIALKHFDEGEHQSLEISHKVYKLLEKIWEYRDKNKPKVTDKKKKQKPFPELVEVQEDMEEQ